MIGGLVVPARPLPAPLGQRLRSLSTRLTTIGATLVDLECDPVRLVVERADLVGVTARRRARANVAYTDAWARFVTVGTAVRAAEEVAIEVRGARRRRPDEPRAARIAELLNRAGPDRNPVEDELDRIEADCVEVAAFLRETGAEWEATVLRLGELARRVVELTTPGRADLVVLDRRIRSAIELAGRDPIAVDRALVEVLEHAVERLSVRPVRPGADPEIRGRLLAYRAMAESRGLSGDTRAESLFQRARIVAELPGAPTGDVARFVEAYIAVVRGHNEEIS